MEYLQEDNVQFDIDRVPTHCAFCNGAMWRAHVCGACGKCACGGCCLHCRHCKHGPPLVFCRMLTEALLENKLAIDSSTPPVVPGGSVRFRYENDPVVLRKESFVLNCPVCMGAMHNSKLCSSCSQNMCGSCVEKTRSVCPWCRIKTEWVALHYLDSALANNTIVCTLCAETMPLDATHRCLKRRVHSTQNHLHNSLSVLLFPLFLASLE